MLDYWLSKFVCEARKENGDERAIFYNGDARSPEA